MHEFDLTIFDDGSADGTSDKIRSQFPTTEIYQGDGSAYWAKGMATAEQIVLSRPTVQDDDYLVWLNDDVQLDADAVDRLIKWVEAKPESVLVGAVRDSHTGELTYSGLQGSGPHPLSFARVPPSASEVISVDTFNGNLVVVPVRIARDLGGIDGDFSHAFADIDYGLRARTAGIPVWLAPGTFGTCSLNAVPLRGSLHGDWKRFTGPKGGGNLPSIVRLLRRVAPTTWPFYVASTYALWLIRETHARTLGKLQRARDHSLPSS